MKRVKCESCGARIDLNSNKCPYCDTIYKSSNEESQQVVVNNYYNVNTSEGLEQKVKVTNNLGLNIPLLIVLFVFFPVAGIIYLIYKFSKAYKQK